MTDEPNEVDWGPMRNALANMSEIVWSYHAGLIAAGFDRNEALALTLAYQQTLMNNALNQ